ncbi:hypothetical protein BU24DRAFT_423209 [Aaosphaeria arxii CBS 175.79]|uniref:Uncharacterized protein n=1 Tax=Aaosphaeria arxii CBS 175.79 TaxID=1450172 RepID=A0A6A5XMP1_9PLEO|nr:uncharacterized protein BU24DRAFT_423209 [Aaosphaeria arxii CBS 175.79]KAF2014176.1 hypothetical protein BU24DRAFT_423209 [Aaosphaeria arxii CBS 175.79]
MRRPTFWSATCPPKQERRRGVLHSRMFGSRFVQGFGGLRCDIEIMHDVWDVLLSGVCCAGWCLVSDVIGSKPTDTIF